MAKLNYVKLIMAKLSYAKIIMAKLLDALPSHEVKPTWGFHKVKLRKVETWRHAPGFQL
jgi:hypothetical protein